MLRTLDAGGDKPIAGLTIDGESNPFLGTRGIRLSLARPEIFRIQLRALARAAVHGNARIMLPMVTVPAEIDQAAEHLDAVVCRARSGRRCPMPARRSASWSRCRPWRWCRSCSRRAAFFSIGSNDLTQYTTASARDIAAVAALNDRRPPGRHRADRAGGRGGDGRCASR